MCGCALDWALDTVWVCNGGRAAVTKGGDFAGREESVSAGSRNEGGAGEFGDDGADIAFRGSAFTGSLVAAKLAGLSKENATSDTFGIVNGGGHGRDDWRGGASL